MAKLSDWKNQTEELRRMGVKLPQCDTDTIKATGWEQPRWIHFGAGNLYRAFHAAIAQELADQGKLDRGVVVAETFSPFTLVEVFAPYGYDGLQVIMNADGTLDERVIAVNAGGVATSGLEMTQNAMHISWSAEEVDQRLHQIMSDIHTQCVKYGTEADGYINYMKGANIAGFMKVAKAMMAQGVI